MGFLTTLLSGSNEKTIRKLEKMIAPAEALEEEYKKLTDEQLRAKTDEFRARYRNGESLDSMMCEAFATVREAAGRVVGMRPYHVQLLGGLVLHQGRIAEMKTGEGKTLVAVLPAYLNAIAGKGVHVVTVNDYLARRDSEWMGKIHRFLGMSVGLIVHDMDAAQRREAYACDITYGTNNELGFDYLRDNMVIRQSDMVQRGHAFAIVDEVDSILIDEARTPLIISGQGDQSTPLYQQADAFVSRLREGEEADYTVDEKQKACILTEEGARKAEAAFHVENLNDVANATLNHHILNALKAHAMMKRDVDYVVQNGEVIIVDEFTGRLMVGRRYSDGLHQAIEAKEHVKVARESKTLATVTFQNYFRMYGKLSGMTGTAKTEEGEFQGIYALDVVEIPTNKPCIRKDMNDIVYKGKAAKFKAVAAEIASRHQTGQPILVGTVNVETSEMLSHMLTLQGVKHEVLNAKNHQKEAEIVAQAGHFGAVTIATNMAGRGTDILLGGNPDYLARREMRQMEMDPELIEEATGHNENVSEEVLAARETYGALLKKYKETTDREHERVMAVGGLHIIGTERHESRRIDNQLRGRAARQGDPGSTQFFISLEDDVMRLFGSDRIKPLVERLGLSDDEPLEAGMLTKQIENAQKRVEGRNYDIRKSVLQYDDIMNQQREIIYGQRRQVLQGEDMQKVIRGMIPQLVDDACGQYMNAEEASDWDWNGLTTYAERIFCRPGFIAGLKAKGQDLEREDAVNAIKEEAEAFYQEREKLLADMHIDMRQFERVMLLSCVDHRWMDHIDDMDRLRDGIGLRAYAQRDPVAEYKIESYDMFENMVHLIREDTLRRLYQARVERVPTPASEAPTQLVEKGGSAEPPKSKPGAAAFKNVGRNDPCPCGSGKKYKQCCGRNV